MVFWHELKKIPYISYTFTTYVGDMMSIVLKILILVA